MKLSCPSNKFKRHLEFLHGKALSSSSKTSKHGCGILSGGRITSFAVNQPMRNMVDGQVTNCLHSEVAAIRKVIINIKKGKTASTVRRKMKRKTIVIVRANLNAKSNRHFSMSAPCKNCMKYIRQAGLKKIVFSTNDEQCKIARVKSSYNATHITWGRWPGGVRPTYD